QAHLRELASRRAQPPRRPPVEHVSALTRDLLRSLDHLPVLVLGRRTDVLAWNELGHALLAGHVDFTSVDNPATHLELTMVHEAMVLEYSGPRLALIEWASAMRLTVLLALVANLFVPWGIAEANPTAVELVLGIGAIAAKVVVLAVTLATMEVFIAKLRLFRVPELLAGSFLLALLAVTSANFFTV
nr:NADH-quinone oxidoreductase subunit H [Streptomyces sp. DSM 41633]